MSTTPSHNPNTWSEVRHRLHLTEEQNLLLLRQLVINRHGCKPRHKTAWIRDQQLQFLQEHGLNVTNIAFKLSQWEQRFRASNKQHIIRPADIPIAECDFNQAMAIWIDYIDTQEQIKNEGPTGTSPVDIPQQPSHHHLHHHQSPAGNGQPQGPPPPQQRSHHDDILANSNPTTVNAVHPHHLTHSEALLKRYVDSTGGADPLTDRQPQSHASSSGPSNNGGGTGGNNSPVGGPNGNNGGVRGPPQLVQPGDQDMRPPSNKRKRMTFPGMLANASPAGMPSANMLVRAAGPQGGSSPGIGGGGGPPPQHLNSHTTHLSANDGGYVDELVRRLIDSQEKSNSRFEAVSDQLMNLSRAVSTLMDSANSVNNHYTLDGPGSAGGAGGGSGVDPNDNDQGDGSQGSRIDPQFTNVGRMIDRINQVGIDQKYMMERLETLESKFDRLLMKIEDLIEVQKLI